MNMCISNISYFSIPCLKDSAQKLEDIYVANYFCRRRTSIVNKAEKIKFFVKAFLIDFEKWVMDLRFCDEDFDFIIRFPWCSYDTVNNRVVLSEKNIILRTPDSDEEICKKIVEDFIEVFWEEFLILPVRDINIGPVPDRVLYLQKGDKKIIPDWYREKVAFFWSINHGGDPVSCWLAGERELLSQGYVFASAL